MPPFIVPERPEAWANAFALFEHFPTLVWYADQHGNFVYSNQTWLEFTGSKVSAALKQHWLQHLHPDDLEYCEQQLRRHLGHPHSFELEYRLRRRDGEYRWILDTIRPISTAEGQFCGHIGSGLDITDRRNTEAELQERETRMRTLLAGMGEGVLMRNPQGRVLMHNAAAEEIYGMSAAEMRSWNIFDGDIIYLNEDGAIIPPEQTPSVQALRTGTPQRGTIGLIRPDGERRWLWVNAIPLPAPDAHPERTVVTTVADITARRDNEEQLRLALTVFRHSVEAIVVTDANQRILSVNQAFTEVTGYGAHEAIGQTPRLLKSGTHDQAFYDAMWRDIAANGFWQGEVQDRRKNGSLYPSALSISAVRDQSGKVTHYVAVFSDITERKAAETRISYLAQHDPLTGLPNRSLLKDRLDQALASAQRQDNRIALLFLDLDRFKTINDSLGHMVGDRLLQGVALRLTSCVRETDTVSRQGGDEFLIVLTNVSEPDDAARVAEKILELLSPPFDLEGQRISTSFSIGIALYPEDGDNAESLLRNADTAMYHAKENGRNTYRFFDERMNAHALERLQQENALRQALENQELSLYYQPQVDTHSGRIIGLEALLRWHSTELGEMGSRNFVTLAEECGMIVALGRWVLAQACEQARHWQEQGLLTVPISVNLSVLQFLRDDIVGCLQNLLEHFGLEGRWIDLELTESLLLESGPDIRNTLVALKGLGVGLAIDDFGTGHSNLAILKRYPIDRIKIDRSFICSLDEDPDQAELVHAMIQLGHNLHLQVVAEGVDSPEQLAFLRREGCQGAQGYAFCPPLPAGAMHALLRAQCLPASLLGEHQP
ncbi:MAG: sensor domain-containing protein [Zoogloea sp.]|uniref:sensor domain-containing protein n=1 Tax=Zoogloea sp. TaxID=49181 RepID=UPI003F3C6E86